MEIIGTILTVIFVIICILLIFLILIQSNRSSGMGILGGGGSQSAFGSSSADVLTKITAIMATIFIGLGLVIAYLKSQSSGLEALKEQLKKDKQQESTATIPAKDESQKEAEEPVEMPSITGEVTPLEIPEKETENPSVK